MAGGTQGLDYILCWTYLGVVGAHGLTIRGTLAASGGIGLYASDVVGHAVAKYAPGLALVDSGGNSTIEATSFIIPQLVFTDPTTAAAIVAQATTYGLEDWWVDEGPTFHLASRGNHGRDWQARVGPSGLQETGPQVDQIYNGAIVAYTDVSGVARTVGPPGSGANVTDARLYDSDPANPATAAGLVRTAPPIQMGVSAVSPATGLPEAPIKVGQAFLIFQKQRSTAGQASIVGYVTDTERRALAGVGDPRRGPHHLRRRARPRPPPHRALQLRRRVAHQSDRPRQPTPGPAAIAGAARQRSGAGPRLEGGRP